MQVVVIPEKNGDNILPVAAIYIYLKMWPLKPRSVLGAIEEALYERFYFSYSNGREIGLASAKKRMAQLLFYFSAKVITFTPFPLVAVVMDIASKA